MKAFIIDPLRRQVLADDLGSDTQALHNMQRVLRGDIEDSGKVDKIDRLFH